MRSFVLPMVLSVAVLAASTGVCQAAGGLLARLNKSIVPTAPGLPTASPLVGMMRMPLTPASSRMYVLTMISPRATALVGILKGMRGFTAGIR